MRERQRADRVLVARGLFESRARAQSAIAAGRVRADGMPVHKPSDEISPTAQLEAEPDHPYVSRGGIKLAAALDHFHFDVTNRVCLDVGASTGGFTEVLTLRGARRVYAVDVGRNQLHPRLRGRTDIVAIEQSDIRKLDAACFSEQPDVATIDVSFISLKLVLAAVGRMLKARATLVALIKPQFEAGRRHLRKGIVRDPNIHAAVRDDIAALLANLGWRVLGVAPSPILGGSGNREFFVGAERG